MLFAGPLAYFFMISFWSVRARIMRPDFTGKNYIAAMTDYGDVLLHTLLIGLAIAFATTLVAYTLCVRHSLSLRTFWQRSASSHPHHSFRWLSRQDLRLEKHPWARRHHQRRFDMARRDR
jgi:hypothetical protein